MSINPVLARDGSNELFPMPMVGETFLLRRGDMYLNADVWQGPPPTPGLLDWLLGSHRPKVRLTGYGVLFLTTLRMVFVVTSGPSPPDFGSLEISFSHLDMYDEKTMPQFQQPAFGANYLEGRSKCTAAGETCSWQVTFRSGGCGTFLPVFYNLIESELRRRSSSRSPVPPAPSHVTTAPVAFIDPADPSLVYLTQPVPR
jgi:hypothetical protein